MSVYLAHALTSLLPTTSPIIVNVVHPGFCTSEITRNVKFPASTFNAIATFLAAKSCEKGSRNLVWAAVGTPTTEKGKEDGDGLSSLRGAYVSHAQVEECSDYALSDEGKAVGKRIWVCSCLSNYRSFTR